jgi:hypothetical protein
MPAHEELSFLRLALRTAQPPQPPRCTLGGHYHWSAALGRSYQYEYEYQDQWWSAVESHEFRQQLCSLLSGAAPDKNLNTSSATKEIFQLDERSKPVKR